MANNNGIGFTADQSSGDDANGQAIAKQISDNSSRYDMVVVYFTDGIYTYGPAMEQRSQRPGNDCGSSKTTMYGGLNALVSAMNGNPGPPRPPPTPRLHDNAA
ncbi:MAG: hypothetical protein R2706_20650 [Acidimicrobiales bacterium]